MEVSLLIAGLLIFVVGLLICTLLRMPVFVSLFVPLPKIFIFWAFFVIDIPQFISMGDDVGYYETAFNLLNSGQNSLSLLFRNIFFERTFSGTQYLYHLFNLLSMEVLGPYPHSPVAMNICATFLLGFLCARCLRILGFSLLHAHLFFFFLVFHWDFLPWSSFFNMKDVLIATFMSGFLLMFTKIGLKIDRYRSVLVFIPMLLLFSHLRQYAAILVVFGFLLSLLVYAILTAEWPAKVLLISLSAMLGISFVAFGEFIAPGILNELKTQVQNPAYGIVRFILTPMPWKVDDAHRPFLFASIMHWLSMPVLLLGVVVSYQRQRFFTIMALTILGVFCLVHGTLPVILGPRQRLSLFPFYATFQFLGLISVPIFLRELKKNLLQFSHWIRICRRA